MCVYEKYTHKYNYIYNFRFVLAVDKSTVTVHFPSLIEFYFFRLKLTCLVIQNEERNTVKSTAYMLTFNVNIYMQKYVDF